jgi:hypothetical protein
MMPSCRRRREILETLTDPPKNSGFQKKLYFKMQRMALNPSFQPIFLPSA